MNKAVTIFIPATAAATMALIILQSVSTERCRDDV